MIVGSFPQADLDFCFPKLDFSSPSELPDLWRWRRSRDLHNLDVLGNPVWLVVDQVHQVHQVHGE